MALRSRYSAAEAAFVGADAKLQHHLLEAELAADEKGQAPSVPSKSGVADLREPAASLRVESIAPGGSWRQTGRNVAAPALSIKLGPFLLGAAYKNLDWGKALAGAGPKPRDRKL